MASKQQVKQYLAYWFQLGKRVLIHNGREALLPNPVIWGDRYSDEFEACWNRVISLESGDCYLEGTHQTIAELLTSAWDISPCVRCDMPVPVLNMGVPSLSCPCVDLPLWPDIEMPKPRAPINNRVQLIQIRDRLLQAGKRFDESLSDSSSVDDAQAS